MGIKISIIIYSETGNTERVANEIAAGAMELPDTEVRCFNIKNEAAWDVAYLKESQAVLFGTPAYYANMCWQMKRWFDTQGIKYNLGGKLGSAFSTENNPFGGGSELAIMTIYNHLLVYGMLVYSSGVEYGRPPIHIGPTIPREKLEDCETVCRRYGNHIAQKAHEIFD